MCNSLTILLIAAIVVILVGTSGRRKTFSIIPMLLSIAFTPAGLPSTNRRLNNSVKR